MVPPGFTFCPQSFKRTICFARIPIPGHLANRPLAGTIQIDFTAGGDHETIRTNTALDGAVGTELPVLWMRLLYLGAESEPELP